MINNGQNKIIEKIYPPYEYKYSDRQCHYILKKGKNKGKRCDDECYWDLHGECVRKYCPYHYGQIIAKFIEMNGDIMIEIKE